MIDAVTGAFSYTGRFIARRLLDAGRDVRTLSRRPGAAPGLERVAFERLQFDDRAALVASLRGAETLYNTYWIRFAHGRTTFDQAVANSSVLFSAAVEAGVRRIVHISVSNPSPASPYPYFRGKAAVEEELASLGIEYAVVRPTLVFGPEDILLNNIAWILRRFPVFLLPGRRDYRVQPVAVEDVAELAVTAPAGAVVDAAGPDTWTFEELVRMVAGRVGSSARFVHASRGLVLALTAVAGRPLRDVVLTGDELGGLMDSLLVSAEPPLGTRRFGDWLAAHGEMLGMRYVSELERNWRNP